ncbi:MAG: SRPBCC family protein [Nitrososphaerota archaeon]|nr:SRPBCC family protein [Nitrososphaerota archaeon]
MPKIANSVEINASRDKVWEIISDLDNEAEYWWGTKEVRNISREGDVISREITQNFRNHRITQKVILRPKDEIEIQYLKGLTEGVKRLKLESMGDSTQKLTATWDVHFPGIWVLMTYFISRHVRKGNTDALDRIKKTSEAKSQS